jgi:hypothetical protein
MRFFMNSLAAAVPGKSVDRLIAILAIALVALCCGLTVSNSSIQFEMFNADQLTVPSFVEDILGNPYFTPFTWMIPRAPYAFPDLPAYLLVRLASRDSYAAIMVYLALHALAVMVAGHLIIRRALPDSARAQFAFLAFVGLCCAWLAFSTALSGGEVLLPPFVAIQHATAVVSALVAFLLYEAVLDSRALWKHCLATGLCCIFVFSDKLFVFFFCVPYACAVLLTARGSRAWTRLGLFVLQMTIAIAIALCIDRLFLQQPIDPVEFTQLPGHVAYIAQLMHEQGPWPWLWLLAGTIAALILFYLNGLRGRAELRKLQLGQRRARIFLAALTILGLAIAVLLWRERDFGYSRYAVGLELGALLSVAILGGDLAPTIAWRRLGVGVLIVLLVIPTLVAARPVSPMHPFVERQQITDALAMCRDRYHLDTGFAGYWTAKKLSMATDWNIQVNQFQSGYPAPYFWGNNLSWFYFNMRSGRPTVYNFIVTNGLNRAAVELLYGKPSHEAECGRAHVMVFDDPLSLKARALTLFAFIEPAMAGYLTPLSKAFSATRDLTIGIGNLSSGTGRVANDVARASSPADQPGFLLFGPYMILPSGNYALTLSYACAGSDKPGYFDVTASLGAAELAKSVIDPNTTPCTGEAESMTLRFKIGRPTSGIEFRTFFGGSGSLEVRQMRLRQE